MALSPAPLSIVAAQGGEDVFALNQQAARVYDQGNWPSKRRGELVTGYPCHAQT